MHVCKYERKIPKIPTSEAINKMISRASRKYATIFKILMETGVMPFELSQVTERDIDLEKGIINVQGFKGHTSRSFKLKSDTVAMLKQYLQTYTCDKPFPNPLWIGKMWRKFRNSLSEKLKDKSQNYQAIRFKTLLRNNDPP
jgi:integrase